MKFRRSEAIRKQPIRSIDVIAGETVQDTGFSPDRDIPPEVRTALFRELYRFANRKAWFEFVILFNQLEMLFPGMDGREKVVIPWNELQRYWENGVSPFATFNTQITLKDSRGTDPRYTNPADVAMELKTYGLPIDTFLTPELERDLRTECDNALDRDSTRFAESAVIAVRLGVFKKERPFRRPEQAWKRLESFMSPKEMTSDRIKSIALSKILFPEQAVEVSAELITAVRKEAIKQMRVLDPSQSAELFEALLLSTAESVTIGENGKLVIQRQAIKHPLAPAGLPPRSTL